MFNYKSSEISKQIIISGTTKESQNTKLIDIHKWIQERNSEIKIDITKIKLSQSKPWIYDIFNGAITNENGGFFTIPGIQTQINSETIIEQPIIYQPEIGYLGIICKNIDGILHFLMQAKIEPGNVNKVQISPTIQATKSNFTQKHGGDKPPYLDYFINADKYQIIVDQMQSEQSSRFYKKRNRNIVILVNENIELLPSHRWMTLGQIKELMKFDNLINMCTRSVLSCLPIVISEISSNDRKQIRNLFEDKTLYESIFSTSDATDILKIYHYFNDYKMFNEEKTKLIPLHTLTDWDIKDNEIVCKHAYPFKIIFCNITIEGREVTRWTQPLFEANGHALFGLICCNIDGVLKFLVHAKPEIGCFDKLELGPSIHIETNLVAKKNDNLTNIFLRNLKIGKGIIHDVMLSEEGGRFYHEENRYVVMMADKTELSNLPQGYFLVTYNILNKMIQINNSINIQLRTLLSLLPM